MRNNCLFPTLLAALVILMFTAPAAQAQSCPPDFNGNSVVDQSDLTAFAKCWQLSLEADFDRDGLVDIPDQFAFLSAWIGNRCSADLDRDDQVYTDLDDLNGFFFDFYQPCVGVDTDCNNDDVFDVADFTIFLTGWCAQTGC